MSIKTFLVYAFTTLSVFGVAHGNDLPTAKIVAVKSCAKVGVTGKGIIIGENLSFFMPDPNQLISAQEDLSKVAELRIDQQIQKGRYWASFTAISDETECKKWKNAIYSHKETMRMRRDLFIFRSAFEAFATNLQTTGLGIMTAGASQSFPFIYGGSFRFSLFPRGSIGHDFVSQNVGFSAEIQYALGQEDWNFDTGESIQPSLLNIKGGLVLRPFFVGDRSPSSFLLGAESFALDFKLKNPGTFERSPLRQVACTGLLLGAAQELLLFEEFGLAVSGSVTLAPSCSTDAINQQEAKRLQEKQRQRGAQPLALAEIVSTEELTSTSAFQVRAQFNYLPMNSLRFFLGSGFQGFQSKIDRDLLVQELSFNRLEAFLGTDIVLR